MKGFRQNFTQVGPLQNQYPCESPRSFHLKVSIKYKNYFSRNQTSDFIKKPLQPEIRKVFVFKIYEHDLDILVCYLYKYVISVNRKYDQAKYKDFFRKSHFLLTLSYFWWWLLLSNLDEMSNSWRNFQNFCLLGAFQRDFVNEESAARRFQHIARISNFHLIWWKGWTNQSYYARTFPA